MKPKMAKAGHTARARASFSSQHQVGARARALRRDVVAAEPAGKARHAAELGEQLPRHVDAQLARPVVRYAAASRRQDACYA